MSIQLLIFLALYTCFYSQRGDRECLRNTSEIIIFAFLFGDANEKKNLEKIDFRWLWLYIYSMYTVYVTFMSLFSSLFF